jgi:murein DD-endopeptidase MepM/ murein hydrolase activator NlpD
MGTVESQIRAACETRVNGQSREARGRTPVLQDLALTLGAALLALAIPSPRAFAAGMEATPQSHGTYRLPFADGTHVKVFDDFLTHRPQGRVDLYAVDGSGPYRVAAAAAGRIVAIQDGYSEQQSGRAAALCHNNYVWISHPNGEWTNYSHVAYHSVTGKAGLKVGDAVKAGQYIGDEDEIGCAMLKHVHFEVAVPDAAQPVDSGGFLTDNESGKRERNPRFCGVAGDNAVKGQTYTAVACK